ncbi:MAG: hypothetical protein QOG10_637 [Kribbellaceae bacterium]|jgi:hypothetical protein|nr:hypothetical protein [Kribbellaceae bacterium]
MTIGGCGARITGKPRADGPLQIVATVPHEPLSAESAFLLAQIDMRVTNLTDSALRVSTNGSGADMTVAKNGIVVATLSPLVGWSDVADVRMSSGRDG